MRDRAAPVLIAGLGNLLMRDDGVGVHAVGLLQADPPRDATLADIGTAALHALHLFEEAHHIIVIDAMEGGQPPGTVYRLAGENLALDPPPQSLHSLGLAGILRMLAPQYRPQVYVVGVEPEIIDYGVELSGPVQAALPEVCRQVRELVASIEAERFCPKTEVTAAQAVRGSCSALR